MKRLIKFFKSMERNNSTYSSIYEGPIYDPVFDEIIFDPTYWYKNIALCFERTNKHTLDKACIKINIPLKNLKIYNNNFNEIALSDFILREWNKYVRELNSKIYNRKRTDKENGAFYSFQPNNNVLQRNATYIEYFNNEKCVGIILVIQWPLRNHKKAMNMTCKMLTKEIDKFISCFSVEKLHKSIDLWNIQEKIRKWLRNSNYCSFIANGSILPREKGSNIPLEKAIPFVSPKKDEVEIYGIKGMGIKKGVTVISGGGYSGKSTLLDAISGGIYNHIIGDGRELVISDESAMEISAEEGRPVNNINISAFIKWIPNGTSEHFSTEHASGSTSQAANIIEAINIKSKLLLVDEDKSATNFMIKDKIMKRLIKHEPIIPYKERVRELYEEIGVSTILVIGGSGEYLSVADNIIMMNDFVAENITEIARNMCKDNVNNLKSKKKNINISNTKWDCKRIISSSNFTSYPKNCGTEKLYISDLGYIFIGDERIDIRNLHNISSFAQLSAIAFLLRYLEIKNKANIIDIEKIIDEILNLLQTKNLDIIFSSFFPNCKRWLELPRKSEIYAVINRMRYLDFICTREEN